MSNWFIKLIRIAGASFPGSSSLVQYYSELESINTDERISKFEDPISYIHKDIGQLSEMIYIQVKAQDSWSLKFDDNFYRKFKRCLAVLNKANLIGMTRGLGHSVPDGINLSDSTFLLYLCDKYEQKHKMDELFHIVDRCESGIWLDGEMLRDSLELPLVVISAVFDVFESKGYGIKSKTIGRYQYLSR